MNMSYFAYTPEVLILVSLFKDNLSPPLIFKI